MRTEEVEASQERLLKRLRRIEGQVCGIEKMIEDNRDCMSIVMQLVAVRSGIEGIDALVLNNCMKLCFYKGPILNNLTFLLNAARLNSPSICVMNF